MIDCRSKISETIYVFDLLETEIFMELLTFLSFFLTMRKKEERRKKKEERRKKKETRKEGSDDVSIRKPEYRI